MKKRVNGVWTDIGGSTAPFKMNATNDTILPVDNADSWVVGSDRMDRDAADATKDIRAFFNKVKGAFRSGRVAGTQWDDANVGFRSAAFGDDSRALGNDSLAGGRQCNADGPQSVAWGVQTSTGGQGVVAMGYACYADSIGSAAFGSTAQARGWGSIALGRDVFAEADASIVTGRDTRATANFATTGGRYALASRQGQWTRATHQFAAQGDSQHSLMVLAAETTAAAPTKIMTTDNGGVTTSGSGTNVLTLDPSRAYRVIVDGVARRTDAQGEMAGFQWSGLVGRDSTGPARIIGTPTPATGWADAGATAWTMPVALDASNYLKVTATGEAGKNIRWTATVRFTEVGG